MHIQRHYMNTNNKTYLDPTENEMNQPLLPVSGFGPCLDKGKRGMEEAERIVERRIVTDFMRDKFASWRLILYFPTLVPYLGTRSTYITSTILPSFPSYHVLLTIAGTPTSIIQWPQGTSGRPPSQTLLFIIENMIGSSKRKCILAPSATRSSIGPQMALQESLV